MLELAGFDLDFEVVEGPHAHPDLEDPDVVVKFSGSDVELLLANRAELLLALEHLTMEVLGIPSEDHSLVCFHANDYRLLRVEELRISAAPSAEAGTTRWPIDGLAAGCQPAPHLMRLHDTIIAISTPPGRSGIGVVRLSGPAARSIAERILRLRAGYAWHSWMATLAELLDHAGQVVDQVVVTFFEAPRSYTA